MLKISLTDAVAENDGQNHGYSHSSQGRAFPGAIFRWLLELESPSGQCVSGQRARRCGVNRPRCHGVTRGGCSEERCGSCARFKKKMPAERRYKWAMSEDTQKRTKWNSDKTFRSNCISLHEEPGSVLIFRTLLTLDNVNENHLIKSNNFPLALLQLVLY